MGSAGSFGDCTRPPGTLLPPRTTSDIPQMDNLSVTTQPITIVDLLSNSLVLRQTTPYLPITALHALSAASRGLNATITQAKDRHRFLDLSPVRSATLDSSPLDKGGISWRSERMDEALTEDEFYSGPLKGIFSRLQRQNVLNNVSTMMLDGLTVPTEIVREIISDEQYNVRILSIRGVKQLNERKLMGVLKYAVRPTRAKGMPKLRGLYVFTPMEARPTPPEPIIGRRRSPTRYPDSSPAGVMNALGAQLGAEWNKKSQEALTTDLSGSEDKWYQPSGAMFKNKLIKDWAETLVACEGIIHFDAVMCRGPRHNAQSYVNQDATHPHSGYLPPRIASVALGPKGCETCKSSPEGPAVFGVSPEHHLPLLSPPPKQSSSIRAAQWPHTTDHSMESPQLFVRCTDCLKNRWCERCHKWWDESCYMPGTNVRTATENQELLQWQVLSTEEQPSDQVKMGSKRECWACGEVCAPCKQLYIRACAKCSNEYCIVDNDGSSLTACDWCNYSGRRTLELH